MSKFLISGLLAIVFSASAIATVVLSPGEKRRIGQEDVVCSATESLEASAYFHCRAPGALEISVFTNTVGITHRDSLSVPSCDTQARSLNAKWSKIVRLSEVSICEEIFDYGRMREVVGRSYHLRTDIYTTAGRVGTAVIEPQRTAEACVVEALHRNAR